MAESAMSVSEALRQAKSALESIRVRIVGEVSEVSDRAGYKAAYFTLSDGTSALPCLMWRDAYAASGVTLQQGSLVEVEGCFSVYPAKGRMQFTVRRLELAGEGRLRLLVAQIARRLEAEGLTSAARKRPLPQTPERIAVVTSPRGKAIHDVLRTLARRYPLAEVLVAGVTVEGEGAETAIVAGLEAAAQAAPDVIVLVRGGGSYEDLMPFNSEVLARAIAACPVPVVTGIGHEPDFSIADMVADLRASTPTAAAESVAPSIVDLGSALERNGRALGRCLSNRVAFLAARVDALASRRVLQDPYAIVGGLGQSLDNLRARLDRALPERIERDVDRVARYRRQMADLGTRILIRPGTGVAMAAARLETLSPVSVLARGYSASFREDGRTVVDSVKRVSVGERIVVRVVDGAIGCTVTDIETEAS